MGVALNPTIFRAYDIRGIVEVDLDEGIYELLGRAAGTLFRNEGRRRMVVARDARLSSPRFQAALMEGLRATGMDVLDIGMVATPVMYFAVEALGADAGAIVSASHNPPEFNGLKLRRAEPCFGSEPLPSEAIQAVGTIAASGHFAQGAGHYEQVDIGPAYIESARRWIDFGHRRPRVVLDGGNGVAGPLAVAMYEALGIEVIPLFIEPDGTFPNHHPDPLKVENLRDLQAAVREYRADLGIGLDGDGDRLGVVDETGEVVFADRYLIALAKAMLVKRKGPVVFDVKCSAVLPQAIRELGGEPVMWKTGYTSLSAKMREVDAVLGGELSGHTIFPFPGRYFDDGAFAGAMLLYALGELGQTLREVLAPYPVLPSIDEGRIPFPEERKFAVIDFLRERFAGKYPLIDIDGVRVDFGDGWGLVRASNTEPAITTRFEAQTWERVSAIRDEMLSVVEEFRTQA
ncbi:Phosphomannomutase [Chloroflexus aggregans DSM 9485]|uniref:Phosphomannomutase n=2 Tax=Chloroflexus aggregans TaxID=152260 RepID=B8GBR4_CHLAD|nr:Phosphomannomutase [Chloroflexus aggregans DSM 9485]